MSRCFPPCLRMAGGQISQKIRDFVVIIHKSRPIVKSRASGGYRRGIAPVQIAQELARCGRNMRLTGQREGEVAVERRVEPADGDAVRHTAQNQLRQQADARKTARLCGGVCGRAARQRQRAQRKRRRDRPAVRCSKRGALCRDDHGEQTCRAHHGARKRSAADALRLSDRGRIHRHP